MEVLPCPVNVNFSNNRGKSTFSKYNTPFESLRISKISSNQIFIRYRRVLSRLNKKKMRNIDPRKSLYKDKGKTDVFFFKSLI